MVGSSLGELESFLPVSEGQSSWAPAGPAPEMRVWIKNDYPAALAIARREHKPVLVSFSGYACTNCHWMKANIFPRPEVATALKDFVLLGNSTRTEPTPPPGRTRRSNKTGSPRLPFLSMLSSTRTKECSPRALGSRETPKSSLGFLDSIPRRRGARGETYPSNMGRSTPKPNANSHKAGAGVPTGRVRRNSRAAFRGSNNSQRV